MGDFVDKSDIRRTVSLIISEKCNLACVYCYEHNKTSSDMSFAIAKDILDKELNAVGDIPVCIELFGGEPFLNFDLIKAITEYVAREYKHKRIRLFTTTNGTLIHGEIQDWLIQHPNLICGLSLDGNRTAHNLNRSNSYDDIDVPFFRANYPEQPVKMTVSDRSLPYLCDSIKELHSIGFEVECNFAEGYDWSDKRNINILREQLNALIEYYISNPEVEKCRLFNFNLGILSRIESGENYVQKFCGCGKYIACYDKSGKCYPCQMFAPISAGEKAVESADFDCSDLIDKSLLDGKCRKCFYQRICPMCVGSNYVSSGNMYYMDESKCALYREVFVANAKLKALEWERGLIKFNHDEEQALLRSILKIQQIEK